MSDIETIVIEKEITVIEKNGKFWGVVYDDGKSTSYGWLDDIEQAGTHNKRYCEKPTDAVWEGDTLGVKELSTARLVTYKVVSRYEEVK
ncbi:MAG: hypothetical protein ABJG42_24720 [Vibrio splendidus]